MYLNIKQYFTKYEEPVPPTPPGPEPLPEGVYELEYLVIRQKNGIMTGLYPSDDLSCEVKFLSFGRWSDISYSTILGVRTSGATDSKDYYGFNVDVIDSAAGCAVGWGKYETTYTTEKQPFRYLPAVTVKLDKYHIETDTGIYYELDPNVTVESNNKQITLGGRNSQSNTPSNWFMGRIYYAKFKRGDELVADFIPVRYIDTEDNDTEKVCFYDRVTKELFKPYYTEKNSFTAGPDKGISNFDSYVEYLESTSGQTSIDTGITCSNSARIECKYSITQFVSYAPIYNCYNGEQYNAARIITNNTSDGYGWATLNTKAQGSLKIPLVPNTWYSYIGYIDSSKYYAIINGTTYSQAKVTGNANNKSITLFGTAVTRISYFKDYKSNGEPLIYLVPVRIGNIGYMYNVITDTLYDSSGSSQFTEFGNDIEL